MNSSKSPISTLLFAGAVLLFTVATFAMFGAVVFINGGGVTFPNLFQCAFGLGISRVSGLTAMFVFQMIILAGVASIVAGLLTHKMNNILLIVIYCLICLCSLIALIISFNAKGMYLSVNGGGSYRGDYTLGSGPIAYSVIHIVALLASIGGLVLSRKG